MVSIPFFLPSCQHFVDFFADFFVNFFGDFFDEFLSRSLLAGPGNTSLGFLLVSPLVLKILLSRLRLKVIPSVRGRP